ncbi:unnamed protein product [Rotaria sp. Silwood1]|nr:unnamed protein product [Rotaria sp. Silwood1]
MNSLRRSPITGLYHPRTTIYSLSNSSLTDNQSSSSLKRKTSTVDRILYADKSGFLPSESYSCSSRSQSNVDLSKSLSSLDQSILEAQVKRALSCNETMEATIKRIRTEGLYSIKDLINQNEVLERSLQESNMKISQLEYLLNKTKQQRIISNDITTSISNYEEKIKNLENDKLQLKLQFEQCKSLHSKEVTQLEQNINDLKHQLVDTENKFKLIQIEQEKINSINQNNLNQLNEKNQLIEQLQKRITEVELNLSKIDSNNIINQTLVDDVKRINDLRYENEQLKKDIQLLKLKYNERLTHNEEIRVLRKQVNTKDNYRTQIAQQQAEIHKLREQLANINKTNMV